MPQRRPASAARGLLLPAVCAVVGGLLCLGLGCSGRLRLPASQGRVVDRDSGAAVAGAVVLEWYRRGAPGGADVRRVAHSRVTRCDASGHFAFAEQLAPGLWLRRSYGPAYLVYHADYGLQHVRAGEELPLDRARAPAARDDLAAFCRRPDDDAGFRRLAQWACPELTPSRN